MSKLIAVFLFAAALAAPTLVAAQSNADVDAAQFLAAYDKIVTAKVRNAITAQRYATLFANWQGVMIGDGEVWFSGVGDGNTVRITAINQ